VLLLTSWSYLASRGTLRPLDGIR